MLLKAKKRLELMGECTFVEGKRYMARVLGNGDIQTIDEENDLHTIADGHLGGTKDEWFVEHFEVLS